MGGPLLISQAGGLIEVDGKLSPYGSCSEETAGQLMEDVRYSGAFDPNQPGCSQQRCGISGLHMVPLQFAAKISLAGIGSKNQRRLQAPANMAQQHPVRSARCGFEAE